MSNRPHHRPRPDPLVGILGPLDGAQIPGGCDICDAYQTFKPVQARMWVITVHHDDWCPTLAAHRSATGT